MKRTVNMHLLEHHGWTCAIMNACRLWADGVTKHTTISISRTGHMSMAGQPPKDLIIRRSPNIREGRASTPDCKCVSKLESLRPEKLSRNRKCKE